MRSDLTLSPLVTLGGSPPGHGGQIVALAVSPSGRRIAAMGSSHVVRMGTAYTIGVVDVADGQLSASLAWSSQTPFVGFDGEDRLLALDPRGLVRFALDGSSEVLLERPWDEPGAARVLDVLSAGGTTALLTGAALWPRQASNCRLEVHRAGTPMTTISYALADQAAALGLTAQARCSLVVHAATLSPDGGRVVALASVVRDGSPKQSAEVLTGAVLVHAVDGRCLHARVIPAKSVALGDESAYFPGALACSPDGRRFAVARGTVRIFDETGNLLTDTRLHVDGQPIDAVRVALLGDDELLVAGDLCIGVWPASAREPVHICTYRHPASVLALAVGPSIAAIADDRALLLFTLPELTPLHESEGHAKPIAALAMDAHGELVACSDGASLVAWDVATGVPRFRIPARIWASLVFSPEGDELIAPIDGRPHIFGAEHGELRSVGQASATAIQWSDQPRCIYYEEVDHGAELVVSAGREAHETARFAAPHLRCVPALARDGRRALVWSDMNTYGWDLERGVQLWARDLELVQAALSPDGALAVITQIGRPPLVLDMTTGDPRLELTQLGSTLSPAVAWSAQLERLAVGIEGGDVVVVEFTAARVNPRVHVTRLETGHRSDVRTAAFSSDGTRIAVGGADGSVQIFDLGAARRAEDLPELAAKPARELAPGDTCRLLRGPFAPCPATVIARDPASRDLRVAVVMFGRKIEVDVAREDLE